MNTNITISSNTKSFIFDCDGVIIDSNRIKGDSFVESIHMLPIEVQKEFLKFHSANGGMSRREKFSWLYRDYLSASNWATMANAAIERFNKIVVTKLFESKLVPGVERFLDDCAANGINCFVVSAGDEIEIRQVFEQKCIIKYFKNIYGATKSKKDWLICLKNDDLIDSSTVFFGDAEADLVAATDSSLKFIFVAGVSLWSHGREHSKKIGFPSVEDFCNIRLL